jgi:hypothetical protein
MESFYVKAVAVWVPHLLFSNHVPCCPNCKKRDYVDPSRGRWINAPKLLFGLQRHRYLDTWLYSCRGCTRSFAGYNKQSMQLDADVYYGFCNFFLGHGYAVDEELYRFIILAATKDATAAIAHRISRMHYDSYFSDYQYYLSAVGYGKIDNRPKKKRRTLDSYFERADGEEDAELRRLTNIKNQRSSQLTNARLNHISCERKMSTDLKFLHVVPDKDNHNVHGKSNVLPGLGSTKIRKLVEHGIYSAFELLRVESNKLSKDFPTITHLIPRWQNLVLDYYEKHQAALDTARVALDLAEGDYETAVDDLLVYHSSILSDRLQNETNHTVGDGSNCRGEDDNAGPKRKPPLFSEFKDKKGYNGRPISKHRIDCIVTNVFNHRKAFQLSKMMGLTAQLLKIDYNYKIAKKIRVWTKQGKSFSPYKCLVTVQNEDGLTVFWKALKNGESFKEIEPDLKRLRHRMNVNKKDAECLSEDTEAVKVVYVDNCCTVHRVLKEIFPNVVVKLDAFHWLKRWNDVLQEPTSSLGGIFRALMSRALFNVEPGEYKDARARVRRKKKKEPSHKDIMKEANSIIPDPVVLKSNVEAVLAYIYAKDAESDRKLLERAEADTTPAPKRFLKRNIAFVREEVKKQMKHVTNDCLSDPPTELVNIFRHNAVKDIVYVARGTNTNERDNLDLANILSATHIGVHRADRIMSCFFEMKNHRKSIVRCGEKDNGTDELEKLLLLNSFAKSIGYTDNEVPFQGLSAPKSRNDSEAEYMGFSYCRPCNATDDVSNPTSAANRTIEYEIVVDDEQAVDDAEESSESDSDDEQSVRSDHLEEEEEGDIEVAVDESELTLAEERRTSQADRELELLEINDAARRNDHLNAAVIREELQRLLPDKMGMETTLQAFKRFANNAPWIPLRDPSSTTGKTDVDIEEARLFDAMAVNYGRDVTATTSRRHYHRFVEAWNDEVARRFTAWCTGDVSVIQINYKSTQQLIQHHDNLKEWKSLQLTTPGDDNDRGQLETTLNNNLRQIQAPQEPHRVSPPTFTGAMELLRSVILPLLMLMSLSEQLQEEEVVALHF